MNYTLKNDQLSITISSKGGELLSIQSKDGREYLWQGDPTYWPDRAPQLFPYVGRFTDGQYIMDGEKHDMGIHGFFAGCELKEEQVSDCSITFSLTPDAELRSQYDRDFVVLLTYELDGTTIINRFQVKNLDSRTMYFGYGGHPGFQVPLEEGLAFEDYYLEFSTPCLPVSIGMSPTCFVEGTNVPLALEDDKILPLAHSLFDNDAIVLRNMAQEVSLRSAKGAHGVTVTYPQMPYLGIWHKPNTEAPYVCIEPWVSLPSRQDVIEVFEDKLDMIVVAPGKEYVNQWKIAIF